MHCRAFDNTYSICVGEKQGMIVNDDCIARSTEQVIFDVGLEECGEVYTCKTDCLSLFVCWLNYTFVDYLVMLISLSFPLLT